MLMDWVNLDAIFQFIVAHKWWLAALIPFVIGVMVIKARG